MITEIKNAYFGKKYEFEDFSELPFICDVSDDYICRMDSCPLCEFDSSEKYICDSCCLHFLDYEDE